MKTLAGAVGALALGATAATAGGIDRSGQNIGVLFEKGRYAELSFGHVTPDVTGVDYDGNATGNVAGSFTPLSFAYKYDINDQVSFAVILDQPFGADIAYGGDRALTRLGGTIVNADSNTLTGLLRYKFNENFSVHGGLRASRASANIDLRGKAYRPSLLSPPGSGLDGYSVKLKNDMGLGYVVGVAYERPEIALRVALTYNSAVKHDFDTVETVNGVPYAIPPLSLTGSSVTNVETPQSVNLDFQTGIAKDTLLFGQVRWADWSGFRLDPASFISPPPFGSGSGLIDLEDTVTYTLGVGRKFNDTWSGALSMTYEEELDPLVSPLAPTNGRLGVTLAAIYTRDNMKITTGINYTRLGDAIPETGADVEQAAMTGNSALGIGVKVGFTF